MMGRKEAADLLDNLIGMVEDNHGEDYDTALKMGIEALSANGDMISRQAAIDAVVAWTVEDRPDIEMPTDLIGRIKALPSAQPDLDEWCYSCKEYDSERHCCPRWNRVIKETLKDAQPEIIRCRECVKRKICRTTNIWAVAPDDDWFCADAERKTDG